jgi:hypothetical protein
MTGRERAGRAGRPAASLVRSSGSPRERSIRDGHRPRISPSNGSSTRATWKRAGPPARRSVPSSSFGGRELLRATLAVAFRVVARSSFSHRIDAFHNPMSRTISTVCITLHRGKVNRQIERFTHSTGARTLRVTRRCDIFEMAPSSDHQEARDESHQRHDTPHFGEGPHGRRRAFAPGDLEPQH